MRSPLVLALPLALVALGCSVGQKKTVADEALKDPGLRAQTFEATARTLDEHPEWVDEFYAVARKHPPLLDRFLTDTARDLHEPELAQATAQKLATNPASIERVLVATVDASKGSADDRAAIDRAVGARSAVMAGILTDAPDVLTATMEAAVDDAMKKEGARAALLKAMQSRAAGLAAILLYDPPTMKTLLDALVKKAGSDRTALKDALKAAGL